MQAAQALPEGALRLYPAYVDPVCTIFRSSNRASHSLQPRVPCLLAAER